MTHRPPPAQCAVARRSTSAQAALDASYARGLLLHRVLGLALAACILMGLRLMLGTRPTDG